MVLDYLVDIIKTYGTKMIPYYYLWQAKKSLEGAKKTIELMNDPDNYMLEAQRDMLELEVEHFREQSIKFTIFLLTLMVFCVSLLYLIDKGIVDVQKIIG
jgi:hypothetical protein